jgi:hypothetical protein
MDRASHVMHLVSNIKGILKFGSDAVDIIRVIVSVDIPGRYLELRYIEVTQSIANGLEPKFFGFQVLSPSFKSDRPMAYD